MLNEVVPNEFDSVFIDTEESEETKLDYDFETEMNKLFERSQLQIKVASLVMQLEIIRLDENASIPAHSDLITNVLEVLNKISGYKGE